jgi:hypothetical protein
MQNPTGFESRLQAVDWAHYRTVRGPATGVPAELQRLASPDVNQAIEASAVLWDWLCHQHVQIASAALPALPFLLEVMDTSEDQLVAEIMDILLGLARGANPEKVARFARESYKREITVDQWVYDLRTAMQAELPRFRNLSAHANEDIAYSAQAIVEELQTQ